MTPEAISKIEALIEEALVDEAGFAGHPKLNKDDPKSKPYRDVRKDNLKGYRKERDLAKSEGDAGFAKRMQKDAQTFRKSAKI